MLDSWKSRFQSLISDDARPPSQDETAPAAEEPEGSRLMRVLAELRSSSVDWPNEAQFEPAAVDSAETHADAPAPIGGEALAAAKRFVEEHRQIAEELLRELGTLEEHVKAQADVGEAFRNYEAAQQNATAAALVRQEAKEAAEAAAALHDKSVLEHNDASGLMESARAEAAAAQATVDELEQRVQDAQHLVAEKLSALEQCEARAQEYAERENTAACEAAEVAKRFDASQAACDAAQKELRAAKERSDAFKEAESRAARESLVEINDVHKLAMRIAEATAVLMAGPQANAPS